MSLSLILNSFSYQRFPLTRNCIKLHCPISNNNVFGNPFLTSNFDKGYYKEKGRMQNNYDRKEEEEEAYGWSKL